MEKRKIIFVTQNKNKIDDATKLLPKYDIEHIDFEIDEIQSLDPKEVITHKLHQAYSKIKQPCFVVDVSLFIEGLGGFPGPLIKWFWESMGLKTMATIVNASGNSKAKFVTMLGYHDGLEITFFESTILGKIADTPKGTNGYAWDPVFIPQESNKTFAEMTFEEKHKYNMSTKVFKELDKHLKQ